MARLTIAVTAGQDSSSMLAQQELAVTFEAALATLVSDGAVPTQSHVTAVNTAYTALKAVWTKDLVIDYNRATLTSGDLIRRAVNAALAQALSVK